MHGGETWYTCVFQRFHDDHEQKNGLGHFSLLLLLHLSTLEYSIQHHQLTLKNILSVYKNERRQVNKKSYEF